MTRRGREIELLLLPMLAAAPLYMTAAVRFVPILLFHAAMTALLLRVAAGKGPELIPAVAMRALAFAYIPFYVIDAAILSRSAIAASTHLILFVAVYQPTESLQRPNQAQRLLTTALIFIASLATSTHISIVPFVVVFGFLMFRQMMYVSHLETIRSIGRSYQIASPSRSAALYLAGSALIGALLFPLLPRLRNPLIQGFGGSLGNTATGLSDTIDFNQNRSSEPDPSVVARVWMGPEAIPFFTPLRLRAMVYDGFTNNRWHQTRDFRELFARDGTFRIARPRGFTRTAVVQQRLIKSSRLFLPTGTYAVSGVSHLYEGPARGSYVTFQGRGQTVSYEVSMARAIEPLRVQRVSVTNYPVTPPVAALARQIVGTEQSAEGRARAIERYLLRNFQYVQRPEELGRRPMTVDEFLLRVKRGHCEYFAAGMVALLSAEQIPARIVGGFYGGRLNPLTGYFSIRREDAHAWVDVWVGDRWMTFDPTPPALRPGVSQSGVLRAYASALTDSITYAWDRYVLTYGLGDQIALAAEVISRLRDSLAGTRDWSRSMLRRAVSPLPLAIVVAGGLFLILVASGVLRRRSAFDLLAQHLRALDIEVGRAMTMEEALVVLRRKNVAAAHALAPLIALYEEEQFSGRADAERRRALRQKLASFRA